MVWSIYDWGYGMGGVKKNYISERSSKARYGRIIAEVTLTQNQKHNLTKNYLSFRLGI